MSRFNFYSYKIYLSIFLLLFCVQVVFWSYTQNLKANYKPLPDAPNKYVVEAMAFGDKQLLFRILSNRVRVSGNVFGGYISIREYNYEDLYNWFKILDSLDSKSDTIPALASYYFSSINKPQDSLYLVKYLSERYLIDPEENWWWLFQATHIAMRDIKDTDLALSLINKISDNKSEKIPLWIRQFPAFLYKEKGDDCMSFRVIERILNDTSGQKREIDKREVEFMKYFMKNQLLDLNKKNFNPTKCKSLS